MKVTVDPTAVKAFCLRWKVRELALFGSVVTGEFHDGSDVDVLVSFEPAATWSLYDLLTMKEELEVLFSRPVDLVEKEGIRNPFRRHSILSNRQVIYAA